ncbi:MAG: hypothetical protein OEV93_01785 [Candidatus Moranbacteria bacterium]|nr:hypothetical protein [Candidatus Moranbacteria bacterium]
MQAKKTPYPEDLDDTFCVLAAVFEFNPEIISDEVVVCAVSLLTFVEEKEGGPYRTWLVGQEAKREWKDIDLAVNSNIAYFLSLQDVFLENMIDFVEKAIDRKKFSSPYYSSIYSVLYFISRFYRGKKKKELIGFILSKKEENFTWGNALDTSLACGTLMNLGVSLEEVKLSILKLISLQNKDGSWDAAPFVIERVQNKIKYHSGSSALTTSFCVSAIDKFLSKNQKTKVKLKKNRDSKTAEIQKTHQRIIKKAQKIIDYLDENTKRGMEDQIKKVIQSEESIDRVILLPFYFKKALKVDNERVNSKIIANLGVISLFGWAAYDIYDDFLDGEGDAKKISLANVFLRELSIIYSEISRNDASMKKLFRDMMNMVECANFWEVENCRAKIVENELIIPKYLPNYGNLEKLFERSAGHVLGVATILLLTGKKRNSKYFQKTFLLFQHYIIARQLNDDMHDWEDDIRSGNMTWVVTLIIKRMMKLKRINLDDDLEKMREIFWHEVVIEICNEIIFHTSKAKKYLQNLKLERDGEFFEKMIKSIENASKKTIDEQKQVSEFLRHFHQKQ